MFVCTRFGNPFHETTFGFCVVSKAVTVPLKNWESGVRGFPQGPAPPPAISLFMYAAMILEDHIARLAGVRSERFPGGLKDGRVLVDMVFGFFWFQSVEWGEAWEWVLVRLV
jgi:hypothetical protein